MVNILLISFDTLRADVAYSGKFPTISRLAERGSTFSAAVASSPLTPPSHGTVLSGLQPPSHGLRHLFREKLNDDTVMLAEYLLRSGYRTGAITSCPGLNRWYGFDRGFQSYDDEIPLLENGADPLRTVDVKLRGTAMKRADVVADRAIAWLEAGAGEDFFLFLHFFDSHWPYEAPALYGKNAANAYEEEVAYMDHHLGRVLDRISDNGLDEDLAIVFFSDHGEDLQGWYPNDKGGERGHPEEEGHGTLLFDQTQMVALSVSWPGKVPEGRWFDNQVRLVDVTPTLLDFAGFRDPQGLEGESLLPILTGNEDGHRPAYFETFYREEIASGSGEPGTLKPLAGVRLDDKWKVIWEPASMQSGVSVFDLSMDPGEWYPKLSLMTRSPPPPQFDENPVDGEAVRSLMETVDRSIGGGGLVERLLAALVLRKELGITVRGSFASGTADAYSDIDLELVFPDHGPGPQDFRWLCETVGAVAPVLAHFPATHLDMPNLLIFLLATPGGILKCDIMCLGSGAPAMPEKDGRVLRAPAGAMPSVRRFVAPAFDVGLSWQRLIGWSWYCTTKILRQELFEANDNLAAIRNDILIPLATEMFGLAPQGCRWLEQKLPPDMVSALADTVPDGLKPATLSAALFAAFEFGRDGLQELAQRKAILLDPTAADQIFDHMCRAFGSDMGKGIRHRGHDPKCRVKQ